MTPGRARPALADQSCLVDANHAAEYHLMYMHTSRGSRPHYEPRHRYKQVPPPLHFPVEAEVMEGDFHRRLKTLLWLILELEFGDQATVGSDHFVYWNARDPRRSLAPDVFVHLGPQAIGYGSWKTWELGTPDLAVEIVSPSDTPEGPWQDKLERYHELGVRELVRFDRELRPGKRLRIWDRVDDNLLEREPEGDTGYSHVLELYWVVVKDPKLGPMLRVARDAQGQDLLPTPVEHARQEGRRAREAAECAQQEERRVREAAECAQQEEHRVREAAERRVQELEEELRRRGG